MNNVQFPEQKQEQELLEQEELQLEITQTKIKFEKSEKTNSHVAFVSKNPITGFWHGVRHDTKYPKVICVLDKAHEFEVIPNVLYDATLIPMREPKFGYIATNIQPVQFKAKIESSYQKGIKYHVRVRFGNKEINFDPFKGQKKSVYSLPHCIRVLEKRVDVMNIMQVVEDFTRACNAMLKQMNEDGMHRQILPDAEAQAAAEEKKESH